jgi:uncharacterized membrane protein
MQGWSLLFAVEACTQIIADEMDVYFEKLSINWHDEHLPKRAKAARNLNELKIARFLSPNSREEEAVKRYEHKNGKSP